jgi:Sulfotransferase domain
MYAARIRRLPDWLGIGCVKCATSWAWQQLWKHPQIYSPSKEVSYFNYTQLFSCDTYKSFFEGAEPGQQIGEWTPDYFHHCEARHNIKEMCPWIKMLTIFRHPVERAFSNFKHAKFEGRIPIKWDFNRSFRFWRIRQRSVYSESLREWYKLFSKDQIKILWYEDIKDNPVKFVQEMYKFLGVDDTFIPDKLDQKFEFDYHKDNDITNLKLEDKDREEWLEYYLPYTEELEKMTGKDLSHWKK